MAAPHLNSLIPSTIDITSGAMVPVDINGTGFLASSVLMVNGVDDVAVFVSATKMTTNINTATAGGPSIMQIAVRNGPDPSNQLPLSLVGGAVGDPVIESLQPDHCSFTDDPLDVTITGQNFQPTSKVLWGGVEVPVYSFIDTFAMRAHLNPLDATYDDSTDPPSAEVRVDNGGRWSNGMLFEFYDEDVPPVTNEGASPNTPAIPDQYTGPVPPEVYRVVANPDYVPEES